MGRKRAREVKSNAANQIMMELADMGILDDILSALDRIPVWKRLQELPEEMDVLKAQVAVLEEKLGAKWPADICRYCGERAARMTYSSPQANADGIKSERWTCSACKKFETRHVKIA
jgi:hypothetical protein